MVEEVFENVSGTHVIHGRFSQLQQFPSVLLSDVGGKTIEPVHVSFL